MTSQGKNLCTPRLWIAMGFVPNSDAFANCMMTTAQKRQEAEERWAADNMRRWHEQQAKSAATPAPAATASFEMPSAMDCTTTETSTSAGNAMLGGATMPPHSSTHCRSK